MKKNQIKTPKILPKDIRWNLYGFQCEKITELTDEQLGELEQKLSEIQIGVRWSNIEEMNFLCVSYSQMNVTDEQKLDAYKILTEILS